MFGMMRDGIMTGPMTWGMGLGMGLVAVVLVLGAVTLIKYLVARQGPITSCRASRADNLVEPLDGYQAVSGKRQVCPMPGSEPEVRFLVKERTSGS